MARVNAISIDHLKKESPQSKEQKPCVYFINTITIIRKKDESREAGGIKSNTGEDIVCNTINKVEKKEEEGLDSFEAVIEEDESREIKRNELNDKTCGMMKEVEEVEMESKESEEEIKEETKEEEEDDPEYFDTFPTIEELVEDTTSVIDHYLGRMVLGKPFVKESGAKESDATEDESRVIKRNDPNDRMCGKTKEVEEVEMKREQNRSSSSPKRVYFINTITVIRKEDESRVAGAKESDAAEDESRVIKRNDPNDRMYGKTKEVEEVEMKSEESEEEIKEETKEEEEDDPEYFDTFPTIEELGYHEIENDKGTKSDSVVDKNVVEPIELVDKEEAMDEETDNESNGSMNEVSTRWGKYADRLLEMPSSQPIGHYLKHEINKKTINGLVDDHKYNNSLLATRLGIADDVLIDVAGFVYLVDFIIVDIKEDECMPFILRTPFLTTSNAKIKFDKGRMTIRVGNCKIRFVRTLYHPSKIEERIKGDLDPIIPTNHLNRRFLEWEERIKNHQEKEIRLNKWRGKVLDDKHLIGHNFFIYMFGNEDCDVNGEGVT
uniref:MAK10-like protein n=1 Tax=Tanacetum cinerariifolium TaxID=118510 RepID=A0A6L2M4G3_TANCI|nr:hypothetical protein [Tanacetum cinerariifolium]